MIDEKKIEEAAEDYAKFDAVGFQLENRGEEYYYQNNVEEGFKASISWFLDNLWHDGEEMPKEKNKYILMYFGSYYVGEKELDHDEYFEIYHTGNGFSEDAWEEFCNEVGWCSKWLYVNDLLKGGR